jgi:hypothetical protein
MPETGVEFVDRSEILSFEEIEHLCASRRVWESISCCDGRRASGSP